jgi:hypothetical protein
MTREELRELGFSESMIDEQLGAPEVTFTARESAEAWKIVRGRTELTEEEHKCYQVMMRDHQLNTGQDLPKVKYSIKG